VVRLATEFGDLLYQILKERRMSQYRLAGLTNLGPETINRLIKGVRRPTEAQILRISMVLLGSQRQITATNLLLERGDCYTLGQPPPPAEGG
jgi:transcriptional regulator with XRE-family HTH domain